MGGITQAIKIAERDFSKKLYFKEDIEKLIFDLENCIKDKKTDTEQTVRMKILRMFASYGIELEKNLNGEYVPKSANNTYVIQSFGSSARQHQTQTTTDGGY